MGYTLPQVELFLRECDAMDKQRRIESLYIARLARAGEKVFSEGWREIAGE